jgi:hypothetical protein
VNGEKIYGDLREKKEVYSAICSGFTKNAFPDECKKYLGYTPYHDSHLSVSGIVAIILPIGFLVLILALFLFRRW